MKPPFRGTMAGLLVLVFLGAPWCAQSQVLHAQSRVLQQDSLLISAGTRPALEMVTPLPELGAFLSDGSGEKIGQDWAGSWDVGAVRGRQVRESLYRQLMVAGLDVDSAASHEVVSSVERAVDEVTDIEAEMPLHLALSFSEAKRTLVQAREREAEGLWSEAAVLAFRAADTLRELMPKTVALTLIEAAEAALAAITPSGEVRTNEATGRARRLVQWARSAISSGNYDRAIQRAYYACRLLGVILP